MTYREKLITELKQMSAYVQKIMPWLYLCAKRIKCEPAVYILASLRRPVI